MSSEKNGTLPHICLPVIVEGRYDKSAILGMFSGTVITTEGFGVFNSKEKQKLIRRLADGGVILLTDSDGGGSQIRKFISGLVPKEKIYQLYIPRIEGKEKRKAHAGKEGVLGVEGVGSDVLRSLLMPFCKGEAPTRAEINSSLMFELGLTGGADSSALRDRVAKRLDLPPCMGAKPMLAALNLITDAQKLREIVESEAEAT